MVAAMSSAPPHAAGVVLDLPVGGLGEAERLQQLVGAAAGGRPAEAQQAAEQDQVLAAGQVLVDRGVLAGEAHQAAHGVGLGDHVVAEDAGAAGVGAQQGGQHPDGGVVLPAPLGPSTPNTAPAGTVRSSPSTARLSPKTLTRPFVSIAVSVMPFQARDRVLDRI